jgi:SPP1 gp7 family putative phage head morphogenesis protein
VRLPALDRGTEALRRLYLAAESQLQALVAESLASGALASARYRQQRLAVVQQILADLNGTAIPEATDLIARSYELGGQIAGIQGGFGSGLHQAAVELLADNLTARLNDATETVGRRVEDTFRREGLRATALSLIQGGTRREASAQLQQALVDQGVKAFEDRAGRSWGLEAYASMAVRTTTREAVTHGTINSFTENGVDLVRWNAHAGVDDEPCGSNAGKVFSITGATDGYPVLDPPPAHPNCRCVVGPATENLDALERRLGIAQPDLVAA